jgi:hypothetical protein
MDFANPIDDLDWIYGVWKGKLIADNIESESYISSKRIGKDIIELTQIRVDKKKEELVSRNFLFFDKTKEQIKLISFNSEGYVETFNMLLKSRNKHAQLTGKFEKGYNLPPNMKIIKEINYNKNSKLIEILIKMGINEEIVSQGEYYFSRKLD